MTDDFGLFFKGLLLGFSLAAPLGPIGVLCIRRTLANGMLTGFVSGLGTATADALYAAMAAFGLTAATGYLVSQQLYFHSIGGLYLLYLSYTTFTAQPEMNTAPPPIAGTLLSSYFSSFFLTLANPMTILMFIALFAGITTLELSADYTHSLLLVGGVFSGSLVWWFFLSTFVGILRSNFSPPKLVLINRISGIIIAGFGIYSLSSIVFQ